MYTYTISWWATNVNCKNINGPGCMWHKCVFLTRFISLISLQPVEYDKKKDYLHYTVKS